MSKKHTPEFCKAMSNIYFGFATHLREADEGTPEELAAGLRVAKEMDKKSQQWWDKMEEAETQISLGDTA